MTIDRRRMLQLASAAALMSVISAALAETATVRLLLVHGRDQQGQDPNRLKSQWLDALKKGAQGRALPDKIEVAGRPIREPRRLSRRSASQYRAAMSFNRRKL
jgi:hypothetical protein